MIKIKKLTYRDLISSFGNPDTPEGLKKIRASQVKVEVPFMLHPGRIEVVECHEYCAAAYVDALQEILDIYGIGNLKKMNLNQFAGCHVERKTSGGAWWSIHTWGMAFDHNTHLGPFGVPSAMPYHFVQAFTKRGFGWGGFWRHQDGMHFSVTGT